MSANRATRNQRDQLHYILPSYIKVGLWLKRVHQLTVHHAARSFHRLRHFDAPAVARKCNRFCRCQLIFPLCLERAYPCSYEDVLIMATPFQASDRQAVLSAMFSAQMKRAVSHIPGKIPFLIYLKCSVFSLPRLAPDPKDQVRDRSTILRPKRVGPSTASHTVHFSPFLNSRPV